MQSEEVNDRLKMRDVPAYIKAKTGVVRGGWCIYNWAKKGKRSYSNKLLKLRTEEILGQMFTRKSWVDEFLTELDT